MSPETNRAIAALVRELQEGLRQDRIALALKAKEKKAYYRELNVLHSRFQKHATWNTKQALSEIQVQIRRLALYLTFSNRLEDYFKKGGRMPDCGALLRYNNDSRAFALVYRFAREVSALGVSYSSEGATTYSHRAMLFALAPSMEIESEYSKPVIQSVQAALEKAEKHSRTYAYWPTVLTDSNENWLKGFRKRLAEKVLQLLGEKESDNV